MGQYVTQWYDTSVAQFYLTVEYHKINGSAKDYKPFPVWGSGS
jgi:hypothetical protein